LHNIPVGYGTMNKSSSFDRHSLKHPISHNLNEWHQISLVLLHTQSS